MKEQPITAYCLFPPDQVYDAIREGWQPWGNPFTRGTDIFQPCVRYTPVPDEKISSNTLTFGG